MVRARKKSGELSGAAEHQQSDDSKHSDDIASALADARKEIGSLLERAGTKLMNDIVSTGDGLDRQVMASAIGGVVEWLGRSTHQTIASLSERHHLAIRKQLKAQAATHEIKLRASRTAAQMQLQNQQAEMEFTLHRRIEDKVREMRGDSGDELQEAYRRLEDLEAEYATVKLKHSGLEDAFSRTKDLLRSAEDRASTLEVEATSCRDALNGVLSELDIKVGSGAALVRAHAGWGAPSVRLAV